MALGWHISVYRQIEDRTTPPGSDAERGDRLAVWRTGIGGLDWFKDLVERDEGVLLGGDGYPVEFAAKARDLVPYIRSGPPGASSVWAVGVGDVMLPGWEGRTTTDDSVLDACAPDEWLLVRAWDES